MGLQEEWFSGLIGPNHRWAMAAGYPLPADVIGTAAEAVTIVVDECSSLQIAAAGPSGGGLGRLQVEKRSCHRLCLRYHLLKQQQAFLMISVSAAAREPDAAARAGRRDWAAAPAGHGRPPDPRD